MRNTKIEWCDDTWNPITGCSVVSPGCTNCYAMKLAGGRLRHHPSRAGLTTPSKAGPVWNGQVRLNEEWLTQPLQWSKPRRIFVCAHGDLFHESVPDEWIDRVFAVMALSPQHTFQVLTKRAARMRAYVAGAFDRIVIAMMELVAQGWPTVRHTMEAFGLPWRQPESADDWWPLRNVWLGVSAEDQPRADERVPELLATPAAVHFVSVEPMVGPVDLTAIQAPRYVPGDHDLDWKFNALETGDYYQFRDSMGVWEGGDGPWRKHRVEWVIVGGESGPGARPMHPDWARSIRDQCAAAGAPFFFKQWGAWSAVYDRDRDDPDWRRCPKERDDTLGRYLNLAGGHGFNGERVHYMRRVGKKAAGRALDGHTHDGMPGDA